MKRLNPTATTKNAVSPASGSQRRDCADGFNGGLLALVSFAAEAMELWLAAHRAAKVDPLKFA